MMTFPLQAKQANKTRRRCRPVHVMISMLLVLMMVGDNALASETSEKSSEECANPESDKVRLVTREELAPNTGEDGTAMWLSLLGEVYDVTGGPDYYAPGASYGAFTGRDASVPFCTGKFNSEEAEKSPEVLKTSDLVGLVDWRDFYRKHEVYKFVGKLIDPRYYDEHGEPTQDMMVLQERIQTARAEAAIYAKKRKEDRLKKKQEKEKKEKESQEKS